jgi:hypothetical protein
MNGTLSNYTGPGSYSAAASINAANVSIASASADNLYGGGATGTLVIGSGGKSMTVNVDVETKVQVTGTVVCNSTSG